MDQVEFSQSMVQAAQKALLRTITEGRWIETDHASRVKVPKELLEEVYRMVDRDKLKAAIAKRLETEFAERIVSHMAAEIATDIKQILSVKERREVLRHIAREHMESIMNIKSSKQAEGGANVSELMWVPHQPDTWPTRFGELRSDTEFSKYLGRYDDNGPVMERWTAKAGTTVKIVMVSRFGDVGVTEDFASERNYRARLTLDKLNNLRVQP